MGEGGKGQGEGIGCSGEVERSRKVVYVANSVTTHRAGRRSLPLLVLRSSLRRRCWWWGVLVSEAVATNKRERRRRTPASPPAGRSPLNRHPLKPMGRCSTPLLSSLLSRIMLSRPQVVGCAQVGSPLRHRSAARTRMVHGTLRVVGGGWVVVRVTKTSKTYSRRDASSWHNPRKTLEHK